MRLAPDGKIIWVPMAVLAVLSIAVSLILSNSASVWIAIIGTFPFVFSAMFFRDPERKVPLKDNIVIAPADGKIILIESDAKIEGSEESYTRISIFMSPFNVHVNRIPINGVVESVCHNKGKFLTAYHQKASLLNEQQFIRINSSYGKLDCIQIAGWLARRIVCNLSEGQTVRTGDRYGLIRFGSRVDLYIPAAFSLQVAMDQKVCAGETVIGVANEKN